MIGFFFGQAPRSSGWGSLFGSTVGFAMGGPFGALFGAAMGENFDRGVEALQEEVATPRSAWQAQAAFLATSFAAMGTVAKADGRVSEREIAVARTVMERLQLDTGQRRAAIECFNQGKAPDFPLAAALADFAQRCRRWPELRRVFIEIQLGLAWADGAPAPAALALIARLAAQLDLSADEYATLTQAARELHRPHAGNGTVDEPVDLAGAYALIGVAPAIGDAELTRAYRRLLSRHHPDKLAAEGLDAAALHLAAARTHALVSAYERIRAARSAG